MFVQATVTLHKDWFIITACAHYIHVVTQGMHISQHEVIVCMLQLETHLDKITGIIGAAPLAIMGYLPMHRSISYVFEWPPDRPEGEDPQYSRCITHLLCLIGPSCTFETYVQAIGRATGELQDFLQQAGRDSVVVLTEKVDLEAAQRWYRCASHDCRVAEAL